MNFEVIHGDIAAEDADALVNAANTGLAELARYEPESLSDVRFVGYDGSEVATIREVAEAR